MYDDRQDEAESAAMLGIPVDEFRGFTRRDDFPVAGGGGPDRWSRRDVLTWAGRQPDLVLRVGLWYWVPASEPARFLRSVRVPARFGGAEVALVWVAAQGSIGVYFPNDRLAVDVESFHEKVYEEELGAVLEVVDVDVLVRVGRDIFGCGPNLITLNRAMPDEAGSVDWRTLARVLGQPVPYWPSGLRHPELIEPWVPGAPVVHAPARPDADPEHPFGDPVPLVRMSAFFAPDTPTHRTLIALARRVQQQATDAAAAEVSVVRKQAEKPGSGPVPPVVVAAEPLVGDDGRDDPLDPAVRRRGWAELLGRSDALSIDCVRQAFQSESRDGRPIQTTQIDDPASRAAVEWASRLRPAAVRIAASVGLHDYAEDERLIDPVTGTPVLRSARGRMSAVVPWSIPGEHALAEIVLSPPVWVRTADGTLYIAPQPDYPYRWGSDGRLAVLVRRLLDDITAEATADHVGQAHPELLPGLAELMALPWPEGTVLTRDILEAARDGRPYPRPHG